MKATYANCFVPDLDAGHRPDRVLLTEERSVADRAGCDAILVDRLIDADHAQRANVALWKLAFGWASVGGPDLTVVEGVSAADLGGAEAGVGILLPAARGALGMLAAIDDGARFDELETVVAATDARVYSRTEAVQAAAAAAAARMRFGSDTVVTSRRVDLPDNEQFVQKYVRTRDVEPLAPAEPLVTRLARPLTIASANLAASIRRTARERTLLVYEYNPTQAFAEQFAADTGRSWRLVRHRTSRAALGPTVRGGDRLSAPLPYPRSERVPAFASALRANLDARGAALEQAFTVDGVSLWPIVGPHLIDLTERYAAFAATAAPAARSRLRRYGVDAVLVPFDTPPEARVLVRVAQSMGIPTHVLNDGYKGDDFSPEGMSADVALSWSTSIARHYYGRRADRRTVVTGNPRADRPRRGSGTAQATSRTGVLVGSFTFSAVDINCRRSDPEAFLEVVLSGIAASAWAREERVTLKLHPADNPDHYRTLLERFRHLDVTVVTSGDVVDLFASHKVYVTTFSTSLLEAVRGDTPIAYVRANEQFIHPPFSDDAVLAARTANDASELTALLDAPPDSPGVAREIDTAAWLEEYLGPADGLSSHRIAAAIAETVDRAG